MADPAADRVFRPGHGRAGEALYLAHRALIEEVIRFVARRRRMRDEEGEEFAGIVRLRLVEADYEILRRFEGRSSLRTYLTVVIQRIALDLEAARWGKWRPSAVARAAGRAAVRFEQLVVRDGLPVGAAAAAVEQEFGAEADRAALERLAPRLPRRSRRSYVGEEVLEVLAASAPDVEALLIREEEAQRFERVAARLRDLLRGLPATERLVLQLRFEQGLTIAQIARLLRLDQKRLYRTFERQLALLRGALEAEGVGGAEVARLLDASAAMPDDANRPVPFRLEGSESS